MKEQLQESITNSYLIIWLVFAKTSDVETKINLTKNLDETSKMNLDYFDYLDWSKMEYIKEASTDLEVISKLKKEQDHK